MPTFIATGFVAGTWKLVVTGKNVDEARASLEREINEGRLTPKLEDGADVTIDFVQEVSD